MDKQEAIQAYVDWVYNTHKDEIWKSTMKIYFGESIVEEEAKKIWDEAETR